MTDTNRKSSNDENVRREQQEKREEQRNPSTFDKVKNAVRGKRDEGNRAEQADDTMYKVEGGVTKVPSSGQADRVSDMAPTPMDVDANRDKLDPELGERLAREQLEERGDEGGGVKIVEKDGVRSAVAQPEANRSDNGKVYKDIRIDPRDTNAPDAGLTPDGRRIAE